MAFFRIQQHDMAHHLQDDIVANDQNHQLQDEVAAKDEQIGRPIRQLEDLQSEIQQTQQQGVQQGSLQLPLQLTWRSGPDILFKMIRNVQSVVMQGKVYVGVGIADRYYRERIVMEYDPRSEKWSTLPVYMTRKFAMTVLNNQLVLVGGKGGDDKASKVVGVWAADDKKWIHPYPELSIPRYSCSAVTDSEWLVVAGGETKGISSVEVLNTTTKVWQAGPPLPVPLSDMKTAIVGDTFYFMGGCANGDYTDKVYSASFQTLILHMNTRREPEIWKEIPGLELRWSAPLSISGSLLAIGGLDMDDKAVTAIHLYRPDTGDWVKVGDLPSPHFDCTCAVNDYAHREILVLGGDISCLARMDIAFLDT